MARHESVAATCARLIPEGTGFDYAVPQPFADHLREVTGAETFGAFVWIYDSQAPIFGRPFPLHNGAICTLADYNARAGTAYPIPTFYPDAD